MSRMYPLTHHFGIAEDYLEWVASDEGVQHISNALHSCRETRHVDPTVFVKYRLDAIRRFGVLQTSMKLRQLFEVAGPHGRMQERLVKEIEGRRHTITGNAE